MFKDITPTGVRFPAELKERLQKAANKNTRSMNAEIIARIAESFEGRNDLKDFSDGELIDEFIRRWGKESMNIRVAFDGLTQEDKVLRKNRIDKP